MTVYIIYVLTDKKIDKNIVIAHVIASLNSMQNPYRRERVMKRAKTLKRSLAMGVCGLAVVAALVPAGTALADNNHYDTSYSSQAAGHGVSYTDARDKTDYTSSWDACSGGANHTVEVAASPEGYWDVRFVGSEIYGWWSGKSGYLSNYVHETDTSYWALLWFNNTGSYATTISGVWSPDSV